MWMAVGAPDLKFGASGDLSEAMTTVMSVDLIEIGTQNARPAATTPALRPRRAIRFLTSLTRHLLLPRRLQTPQ